MNKIDALRAQFDAHGINAYSVPKVDEFMGEYIRPRDERLAWLTGFTGSAGYAIITRDRAALFVDGRYTLQAKSQAPEFEVIEIPNGDPMDWLNDEILGFDPLLIGVNQAQKWQKQLGDERFILTPNLIDHLWMDRPQPIEYQLREMPLELCGETVQDKIKRMANKLGDLGLDGFISNNPESIAWLLNVRGGEIAMVPAPSGYMILGSDGRLNLYGVHAAPFELPAQFHSLDDLDAAIVNFQGMLGYDANALPFGRYSSIQNGQAVTDPIIAAKTKKNAAEIQASQTAHQWDGQAMIRFLAWLDAQDPSHLDEMNTSQRLLNLRQERPEFRGNSFDTISAWGPNAANPHYRALPSDFAQFHADGLYLVDSGGHYPGATTDITRTVQIGHGIADACTPFTQVLNGLACISELRFPMGLAGRDIDPMARSSLWASGRDYGHGTGHGVGAELSVHEGPASISKRSETALEAGMILSLEPGYYLAGEYGIRLENLALVVKNGDFLSFETLSYVPFDLRMIDPKQFAPQTRDWLNQYHKEVRQRHLADLDDETKNWLINATEPIS